MKTTGRYEVIEKIDSGYFATVYRAHDRELNREVAIKQIHRQFLDDKEQLERYWREAQLLASLQHPNILTIHDIVRPRGWLILELMQRSLKPKGQADPVALEPLRTVLVCCLNALQTLHHNGVVHSDVKPGNMLLDSQDRVKLGDFGLARRAKNDDGSLLKGTAMYMAPEMICEQFGPVGPPADLYSLGFSAYELACGPQFETLFPALETFGHNPQMAWLMWHTTRDQSLPPIARVLEGVPEDLAHVIEKLTNKDQQKRYQSAIDALDDLRIDPTLVDRRPQQKDSEAEAARIRAIKRRQRLRAGATCAVACSLVVTIVTLLPGKPKSVAPELPGPMQGVVRTIYQDEQKLVLQLSEDGSPKELTVKPRDRIFINDTARLLRDLQPGDLANVKIVRDEAGRQITEIFTSRPEVTKGHVAAVRPDLGQLTVVIEEGEDHDKQLILSVPETLEITFNGEAPPENNPTSLGDLLPDDQVVVHHVDDQNGRRATELSVRRVVSFQGVVRDLNVAKRVLTVADGRSDNSRLVQLPFAAGCEVTINDRRIIAQRVLKCTDLRPGDRVKVAHDTRFVRVNAYRVLQRAGVIRKVHYSAKTIDIAPNGKEKPTTYLIGSKCNISLGGVPIGLDELRDGDTVEITHDSPDVKTPEALTVVAKRQPDRSRWAILIGTQNYEDRSLSKLSHPVADTTQIRNALVHRYRVPSDQALLLNDESLVRLEQGIADLLHRVGPDGKVMLYVAGHAYCDEDGLVYLAPRNFDLHRMKTTGMPLQWLVDLLETCQAKDKLLLLDCSNRGDGADLTQQPSTAEMMRSLKTPPGRAPLRTVTAIASCEKGQRGLKADTTNRGLFADYLASGFSGKADKNLDNRLEVTELFAFLTRSMADHTGKAMQKQTPVLFLPDDRPPRLSDEAKKAIRRLASHLRQRRIDMASVGQEYLATTKLAGEEIEPALLYGLLLLKAKKRADAIQHLVELKSEHPDLLFPMQGLAWIHFDKRTYQAGVDSLQEMLSRIPKPKEPSDPYPEHVQQMFFWTGQLREFAATVVPENWRASAESLRKLDAAAESHGSEAHPFYQKGRAATYNIMTTFDRQLLEPNDNATLAKLRVERRRLLHYVSFPLNEITQRILDRLDQ